MPHLDTAAYYAYAELFWLLVLFLDGKRNKVAITTMFGVEPTGLPLMSTINYAM